MNIPKLLRLSVILLSTGLLGCSYEQQLEEVAKNWCMTIRASQVIPVYPLTEDLEPGDVFLVQIPVPRQAEQYKQKGFLPLDMHMVRLNITKKEYNEFYDGYYGLDPNYRKNVPPHIWQDKSTSNNKNKNPNKDKPAGHRDPTNWYKAPRAGFPSYTFNVERGVSGAAALPIKGIPVAMSLLGTDKATGSVTIKDTYTYGVPYNDLVQKLSIWALNNKDLLNSIHKGVIDAEPFPDQLWRFLSSPFVGYRERTIYLRIINRVYLTGSLTVSMTNTSAAAVKAATKSFKDVNLPNLSSAEDVKDNTKRLKALNESLTLQHDDTEQDAGGIGAAININWATFRSISLDERFDRPLVIGYLAFDFPVLEGGWLGTPVATQNQISSAPIITIGTPLSPKSSNIIAGMFQRIYDDLDTRCSKTNPNDACSYFEKLNKAAVTILSTHYTPEYRYGFSGPNTLRRTSYKIYSKIDVLTLANRRDYYQDSFTAMTKAIAALEDVNSLEVVGPGTPRQQKKIGKLEKGKPLVIQGEKFAEDGLVWLKRQRNSYIAHRDKLDKQIQTSPEITRVVDYYFSIYRPVR